MDDGHKSLHHIAAVILAEFFSPNSLHLAGVLDWK